MKLSTYLPFLALAITANALPAPDAEQWFAVMDRPEVSPKKTIVDTLITIGLIRAPLCIDEWGEIPHAVPRTSRFMQLTRTRTNISFNRANAVRTHRIAITAPVTLEAGRFAIPRLIARSRPGSASGKGGKDLGWRRIAGWRWKRNLWLIRCS